MTEPNWTPVLQNHPVDAARDTLWVRVCDYIRGPRKLRIIAEGAWNCSTSLSCGADGTPAEGFSDANLHKTAARGCLIAKVGGSAGDRPADAAVQAVGSFCVFEIDDKSSGALFVSMNDNPQNFYRHSGRLRISVWEAP